jgi:hypothetical protein
LQGSAHKDALTKLSIFAGLRQLGDTLKQEVRDLPITADIMDNDIFGPAIRQGRQEGLQAKNGSKKVNEPSSVAS